LIGECLRAARDHRMTQLFNESATRHKTQDFMPRAAVLQRDDKGLL
jgi:hypothetical protein